MREQQPEAEHALGEHIQNAVQDNFRVHIDGARTVRESPDANQPR